MTTKKSNWQKGQSGNPAGKPRGARNKATMMVLGLMEQGAEEITQAVIDAARGGDLSAARMVLERLAPPMRERPISIDLPDTSTTDGIDRAQQAIIEAVGTGALLPGEGNVLAGLVEARRKALETTGLEQRIAMLEEQHGQKGRGEQS
jgi:hypothetical protein